MTAPAPLLARFRAEADRAFPGLVAAVAIDNLDGPGDRVFRLEFADGTRARFVAEALDVEGLELDVASAVVERMRGLMATARHLQIPHGWRRTTAPADPVRG